MTTTVSFMCPSCDTCFVDRGSFQPYYTCEDCTEYWLKEDGRQCPQCHKFGRNTDMPVCDDCPHEVEEFISEVDPDDIKVIDADGNEIISEIKAARNKEEMRQNKQNQAQMKADYEQRTNLFKEGLQQYNFELDSWGNYIIASRTTCVLDAEVCVRALATSDYHVHDSTRPFRLEFRMRVGGSKIDSGWDGYVGKSERFATVGELVTRAKERMSEPMAWT